MNILFTVLYIIAVICVVVAGIMLLRKFVFDKVRINKFIPLTISVLLLGIQFFIKINNILISTPITIIAVLAFAWFMDIHSTGGPKSEKKIIIKSKPKPNRAKK